MRNRLTLFLWFILCATGYTLAQAPAVTWHKSLGSFHGDYPQTIQPTADGGYVVAGYTEGNGGDVVGNHGGQNLNTDIWIVKLTKTGSIEWQKCLGGIGSDVGADIRQTPDGGYIVAGTSGTKDCNITGNHGGVDFIVIKLTPGGDVLWQKCYGGSQNEYAYAIDPTADGGYFVAGQTESNDGDVASNHGNLDFWVIRIDDQGNLLWQKSLGGSAEEQAFAVRTTLDGGCVLSGYTRSTNGDVTGNHGNTDAWITKLDNAGNLQWQKCLGGTASETVWSIQLTTDGGYVAAGFSGSNNGDVSGNHHAVAPYLDFWVVKLSSGGNLQWQKCYGGNANEQAYHIQLTADGGYTVTGEAEANDGDITCNAGSSDMWLIKISSTGQLQWQKSVGGSYTDRAFCTQPLSDGSFIVAGTTCSPNIADWHVHTANNSSCGDFLIVKLSAPQSIPPSPSVKIYARKVCASSLSTLTALALNAGMTETYQWTRNGTTVGTNSPTYSASNFTNNEKVICNVIGSGDCNSIPTVVSDTFVISVNQNTLHPAVNITADNTSVCNCTKITFKAAVTNSGSFPIYQWQVNGNGTNHTGPTFISNNLKQGDAVRCIYADSVGCVAGDSVPSNTIRIGASTGWVPAVSIQSSTDTICTGSSVHFTATAVNAGSNPSYQWKVNNLAVGTSNSAIDLSSLANNDLVTCSIVTDPAFNCVTTTTATSNSIKMVAVNKLTPAITIVASRDTVCSGAPVSFTATPVNSGQNPTFQWEVNGINVGTNSNQFSSSSFSNTDVVTCIITVDPLFICVNKTNAASNPVALTVKNEPNPSVAVTASNNNVCQGSNISFIASVQNAGASPVYQWIINSSLVSGGNGPTFNSTALRNGDAVYCKVIPGPDACSVTSATSNAIVAIINPLPVVKISPTDTTVSEGTQVQLRAAVTGNSFTYTWSPANQLVNVQTLTPSTLPLAGNATFTLAVTGDKGCQSSAEAAIKISRQLYMPNAFTPNNDGLNDAFRIPSGVSIKLKEFSVFNRWGNKVFSTSNGSKGWDGTYEGKPLNPGAYVYLIKGTDSKGELLLKGTVLLIR